MGRQACAHPVIPKDPEFFGTRDLPPAERPSSRRSLQVWVDHVISRESSTERSYTCTILLHPTPSQDFSLEDSVEMTSGTRPTKLSSRGIPKAFGTRDLPPAERPSSRRSLQVWVDHVISRESSTERSYTCTIFFHIPHPKISPSSEGLQRRRLGRNDSLCIIDRQKGHLRDERTL